MKQIFSPHTLWLWSPINHTTARKPGPLFIIQSSLSWPLHSFSDHRVESTHRVATAAFWRTFHHDGKISPGWRGRGVYAHPLSLNLPSGTKLQCTLQLSGQIHLPYFISTNIYSVSLTLIFTSLLFKGTVLRDRFRKCWRKLTDLGLNKGRGWLK